MSRLLPNGGGEPLLQLTSSRWRDELHSIYPRASRIALWSRTGTEVCFSERELIEDLHSDCVAMAREGACKGSNRTRMREACAKSCQIDGVDQWGGHPPDVAPHRTLYAVVDDYPFIWPAVRGAMRVHVDGSRTGRAAKTRGSPKVRKVTLRALWAAGPPHALMADAVASAAERAAIRRLAASRVRSELGHYQRVVSHPDGTVEPGAMYRSSAVGWIPLPEGSAPEGSDEAKLHAVWLRLASLVRYDHRVGACDGQSAVFSAGLYPPSPLSPPPCLYTLPQLSCTVV
jgi:hypothetical protein